MKELPTIPLTHIQGVLSIENTGMIQDLVMEDIKNKNNTDIGIQIEGNKIWICINGIALLRFRKE